MVLISIKEGISGDFWNSLNGLPALTVPCGLVNGMPVGLQIMGPAFWEDVVMNVGYAFEQTNP